ncbi:hypothetical protein [Actinoplanes sp. NPDC051411]|uniref:hypothetical protein n=1 Tax=Actinoplanes sp. NPDC051411 TaxID=3155522 RepID=UPI0034120BB6
MGVIARLYEDEYGPEFGSVVIRDDDPCGQFDDVDDGGLLGESSGSLWGTVARAGTGFLQLNATGSNQRVLIEAHDGEPGPETEPWGDVVETPYFCRTGFVHLTRTTGGTRHSWTAFPLGGPGHYRARVCRVAVGRGFDWTVRFWAAHLRLPAWLVRDPETFRPDTLDDDIYALASWSPLGRMTTTIDDLAGTLLVDLESVRAALTTSQHLTVAGQTRLTIQALSDEDLS